jgi:RHS repeat-associated protein
MFFTHTDAVVGDLSLTRTYSTARLTVAGRYGMLGPGWNMSFETRLLFPAAQTIEARSTDGGATYYLDHDVDGVYEAVFPYGRGSWIEAVTGGYRRVYRAGGYEEYDTSGGVLSHVDPSGVTTTFGRDAQNRLSSVSRLGHTITLLYDGAATRPSEVQGPGGVVLASYAYGASPSRLETVTYGDGSGYRYAYDSWDRIVWVQDLTGRMIEAHEYGSGGAITSEIADGQDKLTFAYAANQTTVTDALGNATVYEHARVRGVRRVTKVTGPCQACGAGGGASQEWTYDSYGKVTSYKDGAGKTWTYTYDSNDDLLTETDPLNQTTTYTYDSQGRVLTRTGPDGSLTTYTHAPSGPLTVTEKVSATESRTTTIVYNTEGKPTTITDPRGKTTNLVYDSAHNLASVSDPLGHSTSFEYDDLGRRTAVTDALNHTTTTTYDARGRVTRITSADGTHTDFGYDQSGRRTTITDPLGRVTRYVYDEYGRLTAVVDPLNGTTWYAYDAMSRLTSLRDAKNQVTGFEYDAYGRVTKVTYPGGALETFAYDNAGRLSTKTDRKSVITTFSYDDLGRLTGKSYSDTTPSVTYTYDTAGRLLTAANGTDTLTWTYDLAGQLLTEQSSKNSSTVAYTYDAGGNRLSLSLDGSVFVSYGYDDASRLTTITRGTNVFGFGYDVANRRTSMTYPNAIATSYTYDILNRLTRLKADLGSTPIIDFQYLYDAAGNRTRKQQLDFTEDYSYDPLYRLTGVERTAGLTGIWHFGYDPVGNRTTSQVNDSVLTSVFNEKNQLLSSAGGGALRVRGTLNEPGTAKVNGSSARMLAGNIFEATIQATTGTNSFAVEATDLSGNITTKNYEVNVSATGASYTYDPNGNLTTKNEGSDTWAYEWNAEDELVRVSKNGTEVARFAYDPLWRRIEKVAGGVTTTWTYDEDAIVRQVRGGSTLKYVHGPGLDRPLAVEDGASVMYLHADGLRSIVKMTDQFGSVIQAQTRQYDAWGNLQAGGDQAGYAFTGREWDPEAVLYYYRARYYDPRAGRFLGEDPIRFEGGMNFYVYVDNGPVTYIDPWGLLKYTKTAGGPVSPEMNTYLVCFERCVGREITITAGQEGGHSQGSADETGEAADIGKPSNPSLTRQDAERCFKQCFPQNRCYGQEEGNHYHFQSRPGRNKSTGFPPGVK